MSSINAIILDDYVKKDGTTPVKIRLYIKRRRILENTGVFIKPEYWDEKKGVVKKKCPNADDYNLIIRKAKSLANDIFVRYRLMNEELTPELFKKEFKNPSTYIDFYDFCDKQLLERKKILTPDTYRHHKSIIKKLKDFKKTLKFSEIDESFIYDYIKYLRSKKKNNNSTIYKNLSTLKVYMNIAVKKDIIRNSPFKNIPIKSFKSGRINLTEDELKHLVKIYQKGELKEHYQRVLQYFLFACFTGLRISDIKRIKAEDIINNILIVSPKKLHNVNAEIVKIPLSKNAMDIIKPILKIRLSGPIFKCYADQVTNRWLKDIAGVADIEKEITFHVARHTFATLFLEKTKNVAVLQRLLGHSKIEQTMIYVHVSDKVVVDEMKNFDELF